MDRLPMDDVTGAADTLSNALSSPGSTGTPHSCRWAEVTLFLSYPEWLGAWDTPWSCRHPAHKGPLETVDTCASCPDWCRHGDPGDRRPASAVRIEH